jgi:hypothetical protein
VSRPGDDRRDEARRFADDLIDYAFWAPLGAAVAIADELPELVRRGRERFGPRLAVTQLLGRLAADSVKRRAEAFVRRPADGAPAARAAEPATDAGETAPGLPIPGYDDLTAAEIVARLPGLTRPELVTVRSHEMDHRARRTVLTRIGQLLGGAGS